MHRSRLGCLVIDCRTDDGLEPSARFWAGALGLEVAELDPPYAVLSGPEREVKVLVQMVDHEPRVHLDIECNDKSAEIARLEALGATPVAAIKDWVVMQAPTGHRFCVVNPQRADFADNATAWG